jgi:hypothetical protein
LRGAGWPYVGVGESSLLLDFFEVVLSFLPALIAEHVTGRFRCAAVEVHVV